MERGRPHGSSAARYGAPRDSHTLRCGTEAQRGTWGAPSAALDVHPDYVLITDRKIRIELNRLETFFHGPVVMTRPGRREAREESMRVEIIRVFVRPRFQNLPRQFEVPGDLPVIAERDVVVFAEVRVTLRDKCWARRSDSSDNGLSDRYPTLRSNLAFAPPRLCDAFSRYAVSFSVAMIARSAFGTVMSKISSDGRQPRFHHQAVVVNPVSSAKPCASRKPYPVFTSAQRRV